MLKILVTGASGFVGQSLVPLLKAQGHDVLCAVRAAVDGLAAEQVVIGPIESVTNWYPLVHDRDVVIHLAAKVHVLTGKPTLEEFCCINVDSTLLLAQQAAHSKVKRFIFMSSIKVNGELTSKGQPFTENSDVIPDDFYAKSKYLAEQGLLKLSKKNSMDVVILRPSLVFGPGVKANFLKLMNLVNKEMPLPFKNINNQRHFVFIENLVSALITVLEDPRAANQIYLIADNEAWSLSRLLECIAQNMGKKNRLFNLPGLMMLFKVIGLSSIENRLFGSLEVNNQKIKQQLNWVPPVSSEEGLARTVKWYLNEYNK